MVACLQEGTSGCPTLYKQWNTCLVNFPSVLLPTSSLLAQSQFKWRCNCNVNGQCFKCKQISIYFYNPGFWQSASVPYWFRVIFSIRPLTCHVRTFDQNTYLYVQVSTRTGILWYIVVHDSTQRYMTVHRYTEKYIHVHTTVSKVHLRTYWYILWWTDLFPAAPDSRAVMPTTDRGIELDYTLANFQGNFCPTIQSNEGNPLALYHFV